MTTALVINAGSSSLKYQLIDPQSEAVRASGLIERIGERQGSARHSVAAAAAAEAHRRELPIADAAAAFQVMREAFAAHGPDLGSGPVVIGHRVVHGGDLFTQATLITDAVRDGIRELAELAPLHNPAALAGIDAAATAFPGVPQVAVFDTAFHRTLPPAAYTYAIDAQTAARHRIRRYGFHGISHQHVAGRAAEFLGHPLTELKLIVLHLGNGASACAVDGGRSVETSMGLTPLEGLVMGSRSGDLDPAVIFSLHRSAGMSFEEIESLLNRRSGLVGLAGSGDLRDVTAAAEKGEEAAELALAVYAHRIRSYVGAYLAQLGSLDAVIFTAGVGENSAEVRRRSLAGLAGLGIELDNALNVSAERGPRRISAKQSAVSVLVIPTDEEREIARQALAVINNSSPAAKASGTAVSLDQ